MKEKQSEMERKYRWMEWYEWKIEVERNIAIISSLECGTHIYFSQQFSSSSFCQLFSFRCCCWFCWIGSFVFSICSFKFVVYLQFFHPSFYSQKRQKKIGRNIQHEHKTKHYLKWKMDFLLKTHQHKHCTCTRRCANE